MAGFRSLLAFWIGGAGSGVEDVQEPPGTILSVESRLAVTSVESQANEQVATYQGFDREATPQDTAFIV